MAGAKVTTSDYPSLQMLKNFSFVHLVKDIDLESLMAEAKSLSDRNSPIPDAVKKLFSWAFLLRLFKIKGPR